MTRRVTVVPVADEVHYRVILESDPCPAGGNSGPAFIRQLGTEGVDAGLLICGHAGFQSFDMHHDGTKWVAVLESTEAK